MFAVLISVGIVTFGSTTTGAATSCARPCSGWPKTRAASTYLDQEGRGNGISNKMRAYKLQSQEQDTYDADEVLGFDLDQRHFDFAAAMLETARRLQRHGLTNNPLKVGAIKAAGLEVENCDPTRARPPERPQCPLSCFQARPRRPLHRHGCADGARRAEGLIEPRTWGRKPPCPMLLQIRTTTRPQRPRALADHQGDAARLRRLARAVLALALRRGDCPLGRQGAFPSAASVPRSALHKGLSPFYRTPFVFAGRRRSPIRNR